MWQPGSTDHQKLGLDPWCWQQEGGGNCHRAAASEGGRASWEVSAADITAEERYFYVATEKVTLTPVNTPEMYSRRAQMIGSGIGL